MALNSLKIATDGYLKRTSKAVLIIAVSGYLNYGGTPPSGGGGGMDYYPTKVDNRKEQKERENKILIDDSEIVAIVQLCLKITTI